MKQLILALFVVFSGRLIADDEIKYFTTNETAFQDFKEFLKLKDKEKRTYRGGEDCLFSVEETPKGIIFQIRGNQFIVPRIPDKKAWMAGGTKGNELWSHYFQDDSTHAPHGQYGISNNLDMERNEAGALTSMFYMKHHQEDRSKRDEVRMRCSF